MEAGSDSPLVLTQHQAPAPAPSHAHSSWPCLHSPTLWVWGTWCGTWVQAFLTLLMWAGERRDMAGGQATEAAGG